MKIHIETIPHQQQRYNTVGDYWMDPDGTLQVRVSEMGGEDYEFPVVLHELVELFLVRKRGIKLETVDEFDFQFETERTDGRHTPDDGPGDDARCPYGREHRFAENLERQLVHERAAMTWHEYELRLSEEYRG